MNEWVADGLSPDLTLLFNVPVAVGLRRRNKHAEAKNRLDREAEQFHRKVRAGFLHLAKQEPRRIAVVDATQAPNSVAATIQNLVMNWLRTHHVPKSPSV
jgi:dTMP kinase